jgi:hypothetical protein
MINQNDQEEIHDEIKNQCDRPKEKFRKTQIQIVIIFFAFVGIDKIIGKTKRGYFKPE